MPRLCSALAIPVSIGGRIANRYPDTITGAGAILLGEDMNLALRRIDATLNRR